ncbi:RdgB/HAM1 family non-canonical purine NTP pyrophosphatase [Paenibacillus sp. 481]|uniref:RdgB/HAM1 family non-canonical purine NTP pyrophosphatase n=1 Tax=Paenibacillus sp. 481 TaxID=2835869 RepID=UPI001E343483|nr:RdgB/HAM1 family non-canonical purine NTP pyrophosphatase [Paenibacillus sp. 481]UHA74396.1 RdgB/HAM1 family non-canonical purine NTP pyrophosphatase [Paenibacillus sp. 481]
MSIASDTIIIATGNKGKLKEFELAFAALGKRVLSMKDYPNIPDVVEDGATFYDNALKKARTVAQVLQLPVLADDSGLCVDRLNGAPGVYSARYAGEHGNDAANNAKLVATLQQLPAWDGAAQLSARADLGAPLSAAQFVCSLVLYDPATDRIHAAEGTADGAIIEHAHGEYGFGYDPYFYVPDYDLTMAELPPEKKQLISHRGAALRKLIAQLQQA